MDLSRSLKERKFTNNTATKTSALVFAIGYAKHNNCLALYDPPRRNCQNPTFLDRLNSIRLGVYGRGGSQWKLLVLK